MREEKLRNARLYNNDKNAIHLPRHSSFMIMHNLRRWGQHGAEYGGKPWNYYDLDY